MAFCLSHTSAAAYWCWASRLEGISKSEQERELEELAQEGIWDAEPAPLPQEAACVLLSGPHTKSCSTLQPRINAKETAVFAAAHELSAPLHIGVCDQAFRQKKGATEGHVIAWCEDDAPFYPTPDGNDVISPTMALIQLGRQLDMIDWLLLAYEFCGTYTLDPTIPAGFRERAPLTSCQQLADAVNNLDGMKGIKTVRRALPYLCDGSASPKETGLALCLLLPKRMSGFGLAKPQLNAEIELGKAARKLYPRDTCRCDCHYAERALAVEYDSDAYHASEAEKDSDALRRAALSLEGLEVVPVSFEQVKTYEGMAATAAIIARKLKKPAPKPSDEDAARNLHARLMGTHTHPWD